MLVDQPATQSAIEVADEDFLSLPRHVVADHPLKRLFNTSNAFAGRRGRQERLSAAVLFWDNHPQDRLKPIPFLPEFFAATPQRTAPRRTSRCPRIRFHPLQTRLGWLSPTRNHGQGCPVAHLVVQRIEAISRLSLGFHEQLPLQRLNTCRRC
jgi:hypothetical protein